MSTKRKPNLTEEQVNAAIADLLDNSFVENGERRLAPFARRNIQTKFNLSERQVSRLWTKAKKKRETTGTYTLSPAKKGKSGRPLLYDRDALQEALEDLPVEERGTLRDMAGGLGVSRHVAQSLTKEGVAVAHTSAIKPILTEEQMLTRMMYAAERLVQVPDGSYVYDMADDEMHADEKWFWVCPETRRVYLSQKEAEEGRKPQPKCKSKRFMIKVMFLTVVARPRFDENGVCTFDGKIGTWPFVKWEQAINNSKNRQAGTWELKPVCVTKALYTEYICEKAIPAAIAKWPRDRSRSVQHIGIQHDNPNTHFKPTDPQFLAVANAHHRFKFHIREQPANSPDTNILDLGFFRALQTAAWKLKRAKTMEGLIQSVQQAWEEYPPEKLNRIWLTHMAVCDEILKHDGKNDFDVPHMGKDKLARGGDLPARFVASERAVQKARLIQDF